MSNISIDRVAGWRVKATVVAAQSYATRGVVCHRTRSFSARTTPQFAEDKRPMATKSSKMRATWFDRCPVHGVVSLPTTVGRRRDLAKTFKNLPCIASLVADERSRFIRFVRRQNRSGRISRFEFEDGGQPVSMSGIELRTIAHAGKLFSPHLRIARKDRVVFEVRVHGRLLGFCQWGAPACQAEAGRSCFDSVRHYYPGADLATLNY